VGAPGDDALNDTAAGSGAVYLFTFADLAFSGGIQRGIVGKLLHAGGGQLELQIA
jgi:hypothetical protein